MKTFVASAANIDLSSRKAVRNVLAKRQDWQNQAIEDIRVIGELCYGITIPSSLVSRVTLFVAKVPTETDAAPTRLDSSTTDAAGKLAIKTLDRLGNPLYRSDLQFDLAFNLQAVGECYLICFGERPAERDIPATPEHWEIRSIAEVARDGKTVKVWDQLRDQHVTLDDSKGDAFIRIWNPDPFTHDKAWANTRAVLGPAEELLHWDSAASAAAKNRLTMAGMIGFPDDLEAPPEPGDDGSLTGSQRFIKKWLDTAITAIRNPSDAGAAVPIAFSYPRNEQGKSGVEIIEYKRPQDELLESRTDRCLVRLEQGIDLPAGVISGLGQATHWGGGQIEESVFRDHVEPKVILSCSALTRAFLMPVLLESGVANASDYFIWYDASNLIIHRDRAANSLRAIELGGINWKAGRRELGFNEADKPSPAEAEEILTWLQSVRGGNKEANVEEGEQEDTSSPTDIPKENVPGDRTSEDNKTAATRGKGRDPVQTSIAPQIQVLCDEKVRRALERAGNRIRNRADGNSAYKAAINRVPPMAVAATLGREAVTKLGIDDLFDDAFTDLNSRILGLLPVDILAMDTVTPINELTTHLRVLCAQHLFSPPGPDIIVPRELIETTLTACCTETLSISPIPA